jgi:CheY-like chemotaxis protein
MLKLDARILIVDDSKLVRMSMTGIFRSLGYLNVVEAHDGQQAVALHTTQRADLIMLDIVMPILRGDEALAQIRATDTTTPIIMLSSLAAQSDIDNCRSYGITDFLVKPLVAESGRAVISQQLARLN